MTDCRKLFYDGITTFTELGYEREIFFEVVFNVYLVCTNARTATLIESANYNENPFYKDFKEWITKWICKIDLNCGLYGVEFSDIKNPQYLVFNDSKKDIDYTDWNKVDMGNVLGFSCPGELSSKYSLIYSVLYEGEPYEFYVETCKEKVSDAIALEKLDIFQKSADKLNMGLTIEADNNKIYLQSGDLLQAVYYEPKYDLIFKLKDNIANEVAQFGFEKTAEILEDFEEKDNTFKSFIKDNYYTIREMLDFVDTDPFKLTGNLTAKENALFNERIALVENDYYATFTPNAPYKNTDNYRKLFEKYTSDFAPKL